MGERLGDEAVTNGDDRCVVGDQCERYGDDRVFTATAPIGDLADPGAATATRTEATSYMDGDPPKGWRRTEDRPATSQNGAAT